MATYSWVDLDIPEAEVLADFHGIKWDLKNAREWAVELRSQMQATPPNLHLIDPLSIAIAVAYSRPYVTGVRRRLTENDLSVFTDSQRASHIHLRAYRDKHVAHSVNPYEENHARANFCVERVRDCGITSVSCGGARAHGLSSRELDELIELCDVMLRHVQKEMEKEQERLLGVVREMPLEDVLSQKTKPFNLDRRNCVNRRRK